MACGPAVFLIGLQGGKFVRNYNSGGEISCSQASAHKSGIVERLCAGPSPVISKASEQMIDRLLVNNSHMQGSGEYLRDQRRESIGEREEDSVVRRTNSMKFRQKDGEIKEEGVKIQRTRSFKTAIEHTS